jgi:predicted ATPase
MSRLVMISGCSSGGKSTLIDEMSKRGYEIVKEPGRRIIAEERQEGGNALPWKDVAAFLRRAVDLARTDIAELSVKSRWVFCDRGLVDF